MKKSILIFCILFATIASAQVTVTKEGYPKFPKTAGTDNIAATDTVLIKKVNGIVMGIAFSDFTSGLGGGTALSFSGPLVNSSGTVNIDQSQLTAPWSGLTGVPTNIDINKLDDFSGDYNDLINKPPFTDDQNIESLGLSGNTLTVGIEDGSSQTVDFTGWDTDASNDVTLTGTQTISGIKTWSGSSTFNASATFNNPVAFNNLPTFNSTAGSTALHISNSALTGINPIIQFSRYATYFGMTNNESIEGSGTTSVGRSSLELHNNGLTKLSGDVYFPYEGTGVTGTEMLTIDSAGNVDSQAMPVGDGTGTDDQTAAEVAYTNNSQTTVETGLDDLFTNAVTKSGTHVLNGTYSIASTLSMDNSPLFIGGTSGEDNVWRQYKSNSTQDLDFHFQNTFVGGYSLRASIPDDGIPTLSQHLITKGYADANYAGAGTGTDNQTAAEVTYDNTASGSAETDVQGYLDEISLLMDELQEYRDNDGLYYTQTFSTDQTITSEMARPTITPNKGKRGKLIFTANNTLELNNTIPLNYSFIAVSGETADSLIVKANTGGLLYGEMNALELKSEAIDAVSVKVGRSVIVTRTATDEYNVEGNADAVSLIPPVIEINTTSNASSDPYGNESNTTTGWATGTAYTSVTSSTDSDAGSTYAIRSTSTGTPSSYIYYRFSATAGDTYTVTWRAKKAQGTNSYATGWQNVTGGPSFNPPGDGVYASETANITVTSTGDVDLRFYSSTTTGAANDSYLVDHLSIIKTN